MSSTPAGAESRALWTAYKSELPIDEPGTIGHHLSTVGQERGTAGRGRRSGEVPHG